jgi:hypothetical protein
VLGWMMQALSLRAKRFLPQYELSKEFVTRWKQSQSFAMVGMYLSIEIRPGVIEVVSQGELHCRDKQLEEW